MATDLTPYLHEIGRVPLLTHREEIELARAVSAWLGDPAPSRAVERRGRRAQERMVTANLRLVVYWAKKYQHKGLELLDLVQEGTLGLIRAVEKFDETKGYRLSTYATWWIRQSVLRAIDRQGVIRASSSGVAIVTKARRTAADFLMENGREPSLEEVAALMGIAPSRLRAYSEMVGRARGVCSLDAPLPGNGDTSSYADLVAAPEVDWAEEMDRAVALEAMEAAIAELDASQQTVVSGVLAGASRTELGVSRKDFNGCMQALGAKLRPEPQMNCPKVCSKVRSKVVPLRLVPVPPARELAVALKGLDLLAA